MTRHNAYAKVETMKQRSTTPVSRSFVAKASLVAAAVLMAVSGPVQMGSVARADQYDDRIAAMEKDIASFQAESARLQGEAKTLQNALGKLSSDKAAIQAQIDTNQVKHDQLLIKISETEKKIKDNQDALGETLANLYVDDNISPLEMLASSKNISEYLDKQEYRNSIRDTLTQKIGEIKRLKEDLDKQKVSLEKLLLDQKAQHKALAAKEAEQQELLNKTKGQDAAYQQLSQEMQQRIVQERAAQAAANRPPAGANIVAGDASHGGYPSQWANAPQDTVSDSWGMFNRECVSYVAWRVHNAYGNMPSWGTMYSFPYGSAKYWPGHADEAGIPRGSTPRKGSAAVMTNGPWGHVAWVEDVYGDGSVRVSQYNYAVDGLYSEMTVPASYFATYIYFGG